MLELLYIYTLDKQSTIQINMKKIFSALLLTASLISFATAQEVVNGPAISIDKNVHDYGTISQGANGACF